MIYKKLIDQKHSVLHNSGMNSKQNKLCIAAGLLTAALVEAPLAQDMGIPFDIPSQLASSALITLGEQADMTVLLEHDARDIKVSELHGIYTIEEAIERLLIDTDLVYRISNDSIIVRLAAEGKILNKKDNRQIEKNSKPPAKSSFFAAVSAALLSIFTPTMVTGQATENTAGSVLEEVIVTARKRQENILEIPVSISFISEDLIARANINGLEDISLLTPNLFMGVRTDGFPNVSIRGLGAFGNTQGVGFYLDDIQIFTDASSRFGDLSGIEILKGPQGTLYGGANIGGAIKFVTTRPNTDAFSGRVKVSAGEDNYYDGEISLNLPLNDDWAARVFAFWETDDSYFTNPNSVRLNGGQHNNDPDIGHKEESGIRVTLAGNLSDRLSLYGTFRYNDFDGPNNIWSRESNGDFTYPSTVDMTFNPRHDRQTIAGSIELNYEFDDFTVTSITSQTDTDSDRWSDLDQSQEYIVDLFRPHDLKVFSQELRFTSTESDGLQWLGGVYYQKYDRDLDSVILLQGGIALADTPPVIPTLAEEQTTVLSIPFELSERERETIAGFINFTYRWDNLELGGGFRVDRWDVNRTNLDSGLSGQQASTEILGRGSLSWFFDNGSMAYGLISQGFEPGGFNLTNFVGVDALLGYAKEKATNYEIGYKGRLLNNRLSLSMAAFFIDYNDRQFELQLADEDGNFVEGFINAGDSDHTGFEADLTWVLGNWTIFAAVGWLDAEWGDGTISPISNMDLSGRLPPNTTKFSAAASVDYDLTLNNGVEITTSLQMRHKGDSSNNGQFFDVPGDDFPDWENPSFTVVDLNVSAKWNNWTFAIHAENIFNKEYYIDVQEVPNFSGPNIFTPPQDLIIIGTLEQLRRVTASIQYAF